MGIKLIRALANGRAVWQVDWRPDGRHGPRLRRNIEGSREEAEEFEDAIRASIGQRRTKSLFLTLEAALPEFLQWHEQYRAKSTHTDVKQAMPRLMLVFGRLTVGEIQPRHITEFVALRPDKRRASQKDIHYLRGMISWMVKQGYALPLSFKPETPRYQRPVPQVPAPGDVQAMIDQIPDPVKKAAVVLMWAAGLRVASCLSLKWEDIDWQQDMFVVNVKGGRLLALPLPGEFRELMYKRRKPEGWVFLNEKTGRPFLSLKGTLKAACRRAKIKNISHHKLRHAYATDTLTATGDLELVRRAMGHRDIATTTIYTQVSQARLVDAQKKVRALRRPHGRLETGEKERKDRQKKDSAKDS